MDSPRPFWTQNHLQQRASSARGSSNPHRNSRLCAGKARETQCDMGSSLNSDHMEFLLQPHHRACRLLDPLRHFAAHVREKTIAFSTAVEAFMGIGMTIAVPYMINPDQADMGGKIGFFFGGLATLSCFWAFLRIPETVSYGRFEQSRFRLLPSYTGDRAAN
jgi:Sugar (and other) transporter